ncbi:glutamate 5-kinase [Aquimarina sp. AD10]|uniref:Glutamate 5-kinase n=2 Tax=Flavobacteriaceae TaxID=49546 RepID=A0A162DK59_9FLAO|nr:MULTISPECIES: glutamate 5-kinase [Aquimarina]AXT58897.1 glutamate 5-kinase [Aquimarina sp. AD10]KZS41658.1 glutamate 5-kinase [Aquimarina aggregata]RKM99627.1 glutamate 5-kinase [Aquimarina sp. AD10]
MAMDKQDKKRIVLKVGSNVLTKETDHISRGKIEDIGRQIVAMQDEYEFVIVSSGAIAVAKQFVNLESNGAAINVKQALASIGQPHLMRIFQESFRDLGLLTSQCLLSYSDFERAQSKKNIVNTINVLLANHYIPIINENDTVATDEIQFGDNDKLAALTASLLKADKLLIATNTNGVYTKESVEDNTYDTIASVDNINALENEIIAETSTHGTGGMKSKIEAARIAQEAHIETWVVNGLRDNFIVDAINEQYPFTKIILENKVEPIN